MPTDMTPEEFEHEQASASGGTDVSFQDDEDFGQLRLSDGLYQRERASMAPYRIVRICNSCDHGAGDFGEWLADDEDPADFGQDN